MTSVPVKCPGAGCTTIPGALLYEPLRIRHRELGPGRIDERVCARSERLSVTALAADDPAGRARAVEDGDRRRTADLEDPSAVAAGIQVAPRGPRLADKRLPVQVERNRPQFVRQLVLLAGHARGELDREQSRVAERISACRRQDFRQHVRPRVQEVGRRPCAGGGRPRRQSHRERHARDRRNQFLHIGKCLHVRR